jgi:hypothetical protein
MYYSELIHDFLEGTLDKHQQDVFFIALSSNEEFRQELVESIRIERSFSARLSQMTPSAASTYTVFSKLGFTPPASLAASVKIPFYKKYMQGIVASVVSIILTSLAFGLLLIDNNKGQEVYTSAGHSAKYPLIKSTESVTPVNSVAVKEIIQQPINKVSQSNFNLMNSSGNVSRNHEKTLNNSVNTAEANYPDFIPQSEISIDINNELADYSDDKIVSNFSEIQLAPDIGLSDVIEYKGWGIELKGSYYMPNGVNLNGNIQGEQFQNIGIGLTYKATDDLKLLIGISNQKFDRLFEVTNTNDNIIKYRQNTSYINLSAGIKYDFLQLDDFKLFAQGTGGIFHDLSGGTGSIQLGIEYSPYSEYTLMLNSEYMVLSFDHQGEQLFVPKVGMNFGVGFNF